ncbi:hypothetical protein B0H21DRAFT_585895 [Amylocystis lapponica]|nr:hypothetical protein B0H21DRAFT_585895 [Amylocystis lapponica]
MNRLYVAFDVPHTSFYGHQTSIVLRLANKSNAWKYQCVPRGHYERYNEQYGVYDVARVQFRTPRLLSLIFLGETNKTGGELGSLLSSIPIVEGKFVEAWTRSAVNRLVDNGIILRPELEVSALLRQGSANADEFVDCLSAEKRKSSPITTIDSSGNLVGEKVMVSASSYMERRLSPLMLPLAQLT